MGGGQTDLTGVSPRGRDRALCFRPEGHFANKCA